MKQKIIVMLVIVGSCSMHAMARRAVRSMQPFKRMMQLPIPKRCNSFQCKPDYIFSCFIARLAHESTHCNGCALGCKHKELLQRKKELQQTMADAHQGVKQARINLADTRRSIKNTPICIGGDVLVPNVFAARTRKLNEYEKHLVRVARNQAVSKLDQAKGELEFAKNNLEGVNSQVPFYSTVVDLAIARLTPKCKIGTDKEWNGC